MQKFILAAALALASAGAGAAAQTVVNPVPIRTCATVQYSALDLIVKTSHGEELYHGTDIDARPRPWLKVTHDGNLYTVTVNREGYEAQTIRNIKVKYDECGPVVPTRVVVRLKPAVPPPPLTRATPQPQPVLVDFGGLLWVYAADGLPHLKGDQIVVPLLPLCDLFAAKCTPDWARGTVQVQQKGEPVSTVPIAETVTQGKNKYAFVGLKAMSGPLGYAVTWRPVARRADVERVRKIPGGLSAIQGDVAGLKLTPTRVDAPVNVQIQEAVDTSDSWKLLVSSPAAAVGRLWPFHKDNYGQLGRSSAAECAWEGDKMCETGTGKGWRYVLVAVEGVQ